MFFVEAKFLSTSIPGKKSTLASQANKVKVLNETEGAQRTLGRTLAVDKWVVRELNLKQGSARLLSATSTETVT